MTALSARASAITLLRGETLEIVAFHGHDPKAIDALKNMPLGASYPVADVLRSKKPLYFHNALERSDRYPHLRAYFHATT